MEAVHPFSKCNRGKFNLKWFRFGTGGDTRKEIKKTHCMTTLTKEQRRSKKKKE